MMKKGPRKGRFREKISNENKSSENIISSVACKLAFWSGGKRGEPAIIIPGSDFWVSKSKI